MPAIPIIRQGEDLEFAFDLDGEDISGWVCTIEVKIYPSDVATISRVIPPGDRIWEGFLSSAETSGLAVSTDTPWRLTGILTNSSTDQERQIPKRFHISPAWN